MNIKRKKIFVKSMVKENIQLGMLTLPVVILLLLFSYWPMFGIIIAFKNYKVPKGIFGSEWADPFFKNFEFFFKSNTAWRVIRNTLGLNLLFIFVGVICAVAFALVMFEVKKAYQVKAYQTVSILPSFLSWVAVSYIVYGILDSEKGIINKFIQSVGGESVNWYNNPVYWPIILLLVYLWHDVGLSSIIYYAALMGIDNELYEAAEMDGAGKWKRVLHISIPHLLPTVIMMTILKIGQIFRADFGLFYNVPRNVGALYPATDVMDTYIYRALMKDGNISMSSAGSFIQSIVCFVTILAANAIVKKLRPESSLF